MNSITYHHQKHHRARARGCALFLVFSSPDGALFFLSFDNVMENSFLIVERHKKNTRGEKKAFDKINMDTVVSSMGPGEIAVVAIGCGLGALLVGSVGAPFSSNFLKTP